VSHEQLAALWRSFVAEEAAGYSPLYAAIVGAAAEDDDVLALVASAPAASQYPLLTLAAVHDLVLAGELPTLAAVYRGEAPVDGAPALWRSAVLDNRTRVLEVLHTRFVQTNECGRSSVLALGLAAIADLVGGRPDLLVDAGASAGLNLLFDRYRLEVGAHGVWGDASSPVVCACDVRGRPPASDLSLVTVPVRVGLDRAPVDVTDPVAARWLLACTWPDTGRLERTRAAIEIAAASPPEIRVGDLVDGIGPLLSSLADGAGVGLACVVTSWAFGYLDVPQRKAFVAGLAGAGRSRRVAWLSLEHPHAVHGLDGAHPPRTRFDTSPSLVGLTVFGADGIELQRPLAHVQPHGRALEWIG
jgi:hypothetical protein